MKNGADQAELVQGLEVLGALFRRSPAIRVAEGLAVGTGLHGAVLNLHVLDRFVLKARRVGRHVRVAVAWLGVASGWRRVRSVAAELIMGAAQRRLSHLAGATGLP